MCEIEVKGGKKHKKADDRADPPPVPGYFYSCYMICGQIVWLWVAKLTENIIMI